MFLQPDQEGKGSQVSRIQLALNVDSIDDAVAFYSKLFGAEPAKRRPGYANFALAEPPLKLVLLENPGSGGTLNHLGVEVETTERVSSEAARLAAAGLVTREESGTCCYATQDKVWATGPGGERWEVYTVLADSATFDGGAACTDSACAASGPAAEHLDQSELVAVGAPAADACCVDGVCTTTGEPQGTCC